MTAPSWRSRLRLSDTVAESWLEVTRRPGRALVSGLGVALGAAAIVATLSLVETVSFQVSDEFDALLATQVELRPSRGGGLPAPDGDAAFPPAGAEGRLTGLSGVEGVAIVREARGEQEVAANQVADPTAAPTVLPVQAVSVGAFDALGLEVSGPAWGQWHEREGARVVVASRQALEALGAGGAAVGDRLFVGGLAFTVVGVLEEAERLPGLARGLLMPLSTAAMFALDEDRDRIVAVVAPGAAGAVADAMPTAVDPRGADAWTAYAPADDDTLRRAVDGQLEVLALGLGGVVMLLGVVSIGNVTLSSVLQRIGEIGLRRALGARPRHIAAHIVLDAAALGAVGGAAGAVLGLSATLGVTAYQGWQPVVDPAVPLLAAAAGLVAGAVAGAYPARVGSRLQPTEALRRD